jgi:hypothetical protein
MATAMLSPRPEPSGFSLVLSVAHCHDILGRRYGSWNSDSEHSVGVINSGSQSWATAGDETNIKRESKTCTTRRRVDLADFSSDEMKQLRLSEINENRNEIGASPNFIDPFTSAKFALTLLRSPSTTAFDWRILSARCFGVSRCVGDGLGLVLPTFVTH